MANPPSSSSILAIVQARMPSRRFPGKVLAPFRGQPLIRHVVRALESVLPPSDIVVATSDEESDDPLALYLATIGVQVFRGPQDDVVERFKGCVSERPCGWILRISADSPLLDPRIVQAVIDHSDRADCDLATTIFPRTFPRGQNAELIKCTTFLSMNESELTPEDQEHVTAFFYRHPDRFHIVNVESGCPELAEISLAVDTVEDLHRIEQLLPCELESLSSRIQFIRVAP